MEDHMANNQIAEVLQKYGVQSEVSARAQLNALAGSKVALETRGHAIPTDLRQAMACLEADVAEEFFDNMPV